MWEAFVKRTIYTVTNAYSTDALIDGTAKVIL